MPTEIKNNFKEPINIVRYLLFRFSFDGDLITNLKMQKLLYYAYVWSLVLNKERCFEEKFQAWPNGPVMASIYEELKIFGSSPIESDFTKIGNDGDLQKLKESIGEELISILDQVYKIYGTKSPFELVTLTHNESPWSKARQGLDDAEPSNNEINDEDVLLEYEKK